MQSFRRAGVLVLLLGAAGALNAQEAAVAPVRLKSGKVPPMRLAWEYSGRFHFLLQFNSPPGPAERSALDLAHAAPLHPSNKLSALLVEDSPVLVEFHSDVEPDEARQLLLSLGLE